LSNRSAEDGLGPDGHISGLVPIDGIVAQPGLGDFKMSGQGALDLAIPGRRHDVQITEWYVEAPTIESDVQDSLLVE